LRAAIALASVSGAETHRPFRIDVDFGQPHRIEAPALGRVDLLEGGREGLFVGDPGSALKTRETCRTRTPFASSVLSARRPRGYRYPNYRA